VAIGDVDGLLERKYRRRGVVAAGDSRGYGRQEGGHRNRHAGDCFHRRLHESVGSLATSAPGVPRLDAGGFPQ